MEGVSQHRLKDRLQRSGRTADNLEHVGGRGLLLQRFGEIAGTLAQLVEQPGVLDSDHRLGGEVLDQLDLLVGERQNLLAVYADCSDQLAFLEHRNQQKSSSTCELENWLAWTFRSEVDDVDRLLCAGKAVKSRRRAARYDPFVTLMRVKYSLRRVMHRDPAKHFALGLKQVSEISRANLCRIRQYGLKDRLQFAGRT